MAGVFVWNNLFFESEEEFSKLKADAKDKGYLTDFEIEWYIHLMRQRELR